MRWLNAIPIFLSLTTAAPLRPRQLIPNLVDPIVSTVGKVFRPVAEAAQALNLPGSSILNPLLESTSEVLSGQGLITTTTGVLAGVLGEDQEFDYIVVGGGTAGNVVATRLAQSSPDTKVAVIEAGDHYEYLKPVLGSTPAGAFFGVGLSMLDRIPTVDWGFQTVPQVGAAGRQVHYARGKCLGGSSALNFMLHHRGSKGSYDMWAEAVGDSNYTLDALLPYFKKSVTFTPPNTQLRKANATTVYNADSFEPAGTGGPVQVGYTNFVAAWPTWLQKGLQALGLQQTNGFNDGKLLGWHYAQATIRARDQTKSTSEQYLEEAQSNQNLKVFTLTHAEKVLFENKKATGVRVSSAGIPYTLKARKEVILSAGTFQSPQLLMVSGIGPKQTLNRFSIPSISQLEGVGQNMWDHVMFGPAYQVNFDTLDRTLHDPAVLAENLAEYAMDPPRGPLSSNVAELLAWEKLPEKYRKTWSPETREAMAQFPEDWPEVEHISGNGYIGNFWFPVLQQPLDGKQYATNLGALVAPTSRGNVTISSTDSKVLPEINPNWMTTRTDQEVAVSWFKRIREVWDTREVNSIVIPQDNGTEYWPGRQIETDEQILDTIRNNLIPVWHAAGTNKMGKKNDPTAVVDHLARVFDVQGLRVIDASIFPLLPPGHPQSTIYAVAEKLAEDIIRGAN